jgi:glycosyltransferase involved in cell wall biosynthesis
VADSMIWETSIKDIKKGTEQQTQSSTSGLKTEFKKKVMAAIPCFNTAESIADVVSNAKKYVDEVIVIDDGSTDKTAEIARSAGATVICHDKNRGKGAAMKTAGSQADGEIIVFIDGDGQHNPSDIPKLVAPILEGKADYVIGSRYLSESKTSSIPFTRRIANNIASLTISFTISFLQPLARFIRRQPPADKSRGIIIRKKPGRNILKSKSSDFRIVQGRIKWITDCTSGFTAIKNENWKKLKLISDGYQIETEMIFEQAKNGFTIAEAPVSCNWETGTSKLSITKDGSKTLLLLAEKLIRYSANGIEPGVKNS